MTSRDDTGESRDAGKADGGLVPIFRTPDLTLLAVVKSALTGADIPFVVQGEEGLHQLPLGPFGFGFFRRVMGAVIRVPRDRAEEAKAFLASFETDPPRFEDDGDEDEPAAADRDPSPDERS